MRAAGAGGRVQCVRGGVDVPPSPRGRVRCGRGRGHRGRIGAAGAGLGVGPCGQQSLLSCGATAWRVGIGGIEVVRARDDELRGCRFSLVNIRHSVLARDLAGSRTTAASFMCYAIVDQSATAQSLIPSTVPATAQPFLHDVDTPHTPLDSSALLTHC